ncbi:MAG: PAS domain S-box protein [Candidatus Obscuribacterales bacterium]|nr:PAS domain S-box protein [Steroidobacteraceae bacterium]
MSNRGKEPSGESAKPPGAKAVLETQSGELAASLSLLKATFEASPDGMIAVDLAGKIVSYNSKLVDAWQVPSAVLEQADDDTLNAFIAPHTKDVHEFLSRVRHLRADPETETCDIVELKDGRIFERLSCPQKIDERCVGVVVNWRDVTAQKRTELALKASEQRFRMVWETAPDAVVLLDEHGQIQYANDAVSTVFGYEPSALIGSNIATLQPEHLREAHRRGLARYLATREKHVNWRATEAIGVHRDGHEFPLEISFSHVEMNGAHVFAGFLRDIRERKQVESAQRSLAERLREAQKMEAIGTLAGGIAHDFNNILGAILGNVVLARQAIGSDHVAQVSLQEINKAGIRAKNLVQQILAFSRKQPQEFITQPIRALVEDTLGLLRATLPAGVTLDADLANAPIHIDADTTQVEQVIMNLCTNAWHALRKETGHIGVRLHEVLLDEVTAEQIGGLPAGRYARLTVRDNGHGMDEETQARIFEPFYTTKEPNKGTGLGLAVVHGIVSAHRGAITVQSALGIGTTFEVYFPAVEATADVPTQPLPNPPQTGGRGQHVLYVDDDEALVFLVERMLTGLGYRVSGFEDAQAALAAVRAQPAEFDLVVTDFNMPGASGLDVANELARIRADLPVVITSGYINDQLQAGARAAGVRHLVHKPNTVDELCDVVQRVMHHGNDN